MSFVKVHPNRYKDQTGFTLIEVLVASFILFLVIASITLVYRGALLSSNKAERTLIISSFVEPISEQIRMNIALNSNETNLQGQNSIGNISFNWSAKIVHQASAPEQFNFATGETEVEKFVFKLWYIELNLQQGSAKRQYQFTEVSW